MWVGIASDQIVIFPHLPRFAKIGLYYVLYSRSGPVVKGAIRELKYVL